MGSQRMWQRVSWCLNVRLNVRITKITRDPDCVETPIHIEYVTLHQELNRVKPCPGSMDFDYLILACPLTPDVFDRLGLERSDDEVAMSSKIQVNPYCMTTYWVENMQMPQPIAPILPLPQRGKPWAVARQFQQDGNHFTQFYTRTPATDGVHTPDDEERIEAEVKMEVRHLIKLLKGNLDESDSRWSTYDRFTYFQHVTPEEIGCRYYQKLQDLQGANRTFYVGGVTDFELVEPIVQHSKHLVETHFVG